MDPVDAIEEMADDYCECSTEECIASVQSRWEARDDDIEDRSDDDFSAAEDERVDVAMDRMFGCMMAASMGEDAGIYEDEGDEGDLFQEYEEYEEYEHPGHIDTGHDW